MTVYSSSQGAVVQAMNTDLPENEATGSPHDYFHRLTGDTTSKVITLSASNTTASENIFQITGTVQVYRLYAEVTDATTLANLTAGSFDLFPTGGAAIQISAAGGVLSGVPTGTFIFKEGLAANAFIVNSATNGAVAEQTYEGSDVFSRFIVTQKTATDTFIRFTYTTTDTPINATLDVTCEYHPLDGGTLVAV